MRGLFFPEVILKAGVLALEKTAYNFSLICSASVSGSLLFLMAVSVAVIRSTNGTSSGVTEMFRPLTNASCVS